MKIVRRLSDGLVQYTFNSSIPHILTTFLACDGIKALDINSTTHEFITDIELPDNYFDGVYSYKLY